VFIWCDGHKAYFRDLDGKVLKIIERHGLKCWIQVEAVVRDGYTYYYYCDGKAEGVYGTFSMRRDAILKAHDHLGIKDEWRMYNSWSLATIESFKQKEGIVVQFEDVVEPLYYFRGTPIRNSFYCKNVYTVDLIHSQYVKMYGGDQWKEDGSQVQEFTLKGKFVRERPDKERGNSSLEIESIDSALDLDTFMFMFAAMRDDNDRHSETVSAYSHDDLWKLPNDLDDPRVQALFVHPSNDEEIMTKRNMVIVENFILAKHEKLVSARFRGNSPNHSVQRQPFGRSVDRGNHDPDDIYDEIMND
jgi:hypothetical protein